MPRSYFAADGGIILCCCVSLVLCQANHDKLFFTLLMWSDLRSAQLLQCLAHAGQHCGGLMLVVDVLVAGAGLMDRRIEPACRRQGKRSRDIPAVPGVLLAPRRRLVLV